MSARRPIQLVTSLALLLGSPALASAQEPPPAPTAGEFSVQRFEPVAGPRNYLSVAGARQDGDWTFSAGFMFDYQRDPFVIKSCVSDTDCGAAGAQNPQDVAVVRDMLTWNVLASLTPIKWVQVGLRVPIAYSSGEGIDLQTGSPSADALGGAGLGDINLEGKVRFIGEADDLITLGAAVDLSFPTGHATGEGLYIGNDSPVTVGGRVIADLNYEGFTAAVNLRGIWREDATFGDTTMGAEFRYGVAAGYQIHPMFQVLAEGFGSTRFSSTNGTNAFEIDGGVRVFPHDLMTITLAGGTGLTRGIGVPGGRAIAGLMINYEGAAADDDNDTIPNTEDQCPSEAEDLDNIEDSDGCPEDDVDHDKIPDDVDKCPLEAETDNNYQDDDGCPDNPKDTDKDGFWDDQDKCPQKAGKMTRRAHLGCPDVDNDGVPDTTDQCIGEVEDTDGFQDTDGCPDPDNDNDGVPDLQDECGDEPENMNGVDDTDGCPDFSPDADNDGVPDGDDKCKNVPENYNGVLDGDGCPDLGGTLVRVNPKRIEITQPIAFQGAGLDPKSDKVVEALANALNAWSAISKIGVMVITTDADAAQGGPRAKALVGRLTAKGVNKERLAVQIGTGDASMVSFSIIKAPPWEE